MNYIKRFSSSSHLPYSSFISEQENFLNGEH